MENNSLQERTGQVAPVAQSPQSAPLQPFPQSNEGLQNTNSQLLEGISNVTISIESNNNGQNTPSTQASVQPSSTLFTPLVSAATALIFISFVTVFLIVWFKTKKDPAPEVVEQPIIPKQTLTKTKTKSGKKRKKRK